ncbi:Na+/H+ antiporter subunit C [Roseicyclus sp. F158]|uniref:Na+/H+ antiporter subunit C n=1 Tax=Tropicimonas omnivorans TaxID=3075590 RepID=A0ABU3DII4_9RHOB|nr:Na+/H+ antiporter subunit C [Roseicyclus sp. F158]MDT0683368.1 Na+/H+ antiporter subunit C [Roseicyclus sp. F158]
MELLVASAIGVLTSAGLYLILRLRTFPVIIGLSILSYAVNVFLFSTGGLSLNQPPIYGPEVENYADPLPQALVLTAIVISFGMTALAVLIALGGFLETDTDRIDMALDEDDRDVPDPGAQPGVEAKRDRSPQEAGVLQ